MGLGLKVRVLTEIIVPQWSERGGRVPVRTMLSTLSAKIRSKGPE